MRFGFVIALVATVVFAVAYQQVTAVCQVPIHYRLGSIDERFKISADEAKEAIVAAEAVWEGPLQADLFRYDEEGDMTISFLYDDRQANTEAEYGFRERLNSAEGVNNEIRTQYESLTKEYEELVKNYEARSTALDTRLAAYNAKVESFNQEGGAPPAEYAKLEKERVALDGERTELAKLASNLNTFVEKINQVGKQGNLLVEQYNHGVGEYNETFGQSREFTQGDYRGNEINIYSFSNKAELTLVLAHEFGHSLGIDHVDGRQSIMYYLIGEQPKDLALSETDTAAYTAVCTEVTLWDRITSVL